MFRLWGRWADELEKQVISKGVAEEGMVDGREEGSSRPLQLARQRRGMAGEGGQPSSQGHVARRKEATQQAAKMLGRKPGVCSRRGAQRLLAHTSRL